MIDQVRISGTNPRIIQFFHKLMGFRFYPLPVFPVLTFLGDFPDVYLGVEIGGKGVAVSSCVAIDDIEILDFVEIVFSRVCRENRSDTRVKSASEKGHNPRL